MGNVITALAGWMLHWRPMNASHMAVLIPAVLGLVAGCHHPSRRQPTLWLCRMAGALLLLSALVYASAFAAPLPSYAVYLQLFLGTWGMAGASFVLVTGGILLFCIALSKPVRAGFAARAAAQYISAHVS